MSRKFNIMPPLVKDDVEKQEDAFLQYVFAYWVYKVNNIHRCALLFFNGNLLSQIEIQQKSEKTTKEYHDYMFDKVDYAGRKRTLHSLFPWSNGKEFEKIRHHYLHVLKHRDMPWQYLWGQPYEELFANVLDKGVDHKKQYKDRVVEFLSQHVLAIWSYDENKYLVHIQSIFEEQELERLDYGFLLMPKKDILEIVSKKPTVTQYWLNIEKKNQKYPWKTGQEGWDMIRANKTKTISDLKAQLEQQSSSTVNVQDVDNSLKKRKGREQSLSDVAKEHSLSDVAKEQIGSKVIDDEIDELEQKQCQNVVNSFLPPYFGMLISNTSSQNKKQKN